MFQEFCFVCLRLREQSQQNVPQRDTRDRFVVGHHEHAVQPEKRRKIKKQKVVLLNNQSKKHHAIESGE